MYAPVQGPDNPNLTSQQRAQRNTLSGYVEKAHISAFNFENQRRTFHTYGYALDPSVNVEENDGQTFVGDVQTAYDTNGKTVFESPRPKKKRKQEKNDNPEDIEGFSGPWAKYENEESVARPNEQQKAELEEILAKRHRRNRIPEEKPLEEKTILHSKYRMIHEISRTISIKLIVIIVIVFPFILQSKIHWTIKDVHFYMLLMMLALTYDPMHIPTNVSYRNHIFTHGLDTQKASQQYDSYQKQHIYFYRAVWIVV